MATITTIITPTFTKIVDAGAWVSLQNTGVAQIEVYISGGEAPTVGFILRVLDAMTPATFGDGDLYIKTRQNNAESKVTYLEA
jgi:hypothetical protein